MAKIRISTVREVADVQVIRLDANFVVKATRIADYMNRINNDYVHSNDSRFEEVAQFFNELMEAFTGEEHQTAHVDYQPCSVPCDDEE